MPIPATVFIPEQFLTHREILTHLPDYGWGIEIDGTQLHEYIREGRVHPSILPFNFIAIVQETAVSPDK